MLPSRAVETALLLLTNAAAISVSTAQDFARQFATCHATSTLSPEFDAVNAIQPGPAYWCSSGHHTGEEDVDWTGTFAQPAYLRGVQVRWAYSPELLQVSVSPDGSTWQVASPWKGTPSSDATFNEEVLFDHPHSAKIVKLSMRKAAHDYFGITQLKPISAGEQVAMVVAGITSREAEMCLQVEGGGMNREGSPVILESCASALAAGDGRELWRVNANQQFISAKSKPPKCLTLLNGSTEAVGPDGGTVALSDCLRALEPADGRSSWTVEANAQLRLQLKGSFCLSQKNAGGDSPGMMDILKASDAKVSSDASWRDHQPRKAIDGDPQSYWASTAFADSGRHEVNFDVDMGKPYKVSGVRIDWEYPPLHYAVQRSTDGAIYSEVAANAANPANYTQEAFPSESIQYIRIAMLQPHPQNGKVGEKFLYGIRNVEVLAEGLQSVVEDCRTAANTKDARDKYFVIPASTFDEGVSNKADSLEDDVLERTNVLNRKTHELLTVAEKAPTCLQEKEAHDSQIAKAKGSIALLAGEHDTLFKKDPVHHKTLRPCAGQSARSPAEDCYAIKAQSPNSPSGFYWLLPRCAADPLRVFCDMKSTAAFYFWTDGMVGVSKPHNNRSRAQSLAAVRLRCAEVGLEPLILRNADQLESLRTAVDLAGFSASSGVLPLAFDYGCNNGACSGRFRDLYAGTNDMTALLMEHSSMSNVVSDRANAAGIRLTTGYDVVYFDIGRVDVAAVVCSTNTANGQSIVPHIDISCETTAREHAAFRGTLNTNVAVVCPVGCEENGNLPVYGTRGIYSDTSSICRAAIHAGILRSGGLVSVSVESPWDFYEGSTRNGITSESLNTPNTLELVDIVKNGTNQEGMPSRERGSTVRSIRLGPVAKDCPIETFGVQTSFLESGMTTEGRARASQKGTPAEKDEEVPLDASTAMMLNIILEEISTRRGVDPLTVYTAQQAAQDAARKIKPFLAPAAALQKKHAAEAASALSHTQELLEEVLATASKYHNELQDLNVEMERLDDLRIEDASFSSFRIDPKSVPFSKAFEVIETTRADKPSNWGYTDATIGGHKGTTVQSASFYADGEGEGTFAILKRHRFFDFVAEVDFYAPAPGRLGLAFRIRDIHNMFLFEVDELIGYSQLLRIEGAVPTVVARERSAFKKRTWHRIRVETTHGHISISVSEENHSTPSLTLLAFDERFLAGAFGLYSSGMDAGVFFDNIRIESKPCSKISSQKFHLPPECATFEELYLERPARIYEPIALPGFLGGDHIWNYVADTAGRHRVLQPQPLTNQGFAAATTIFKNPRLCTNGVFSFDLHPTCPAATIGALFRYESPRNYNLLEVSGEKMALYTVRNGIKVPSSSSNIHLEPNSWHKLSVTFNGPSVNASLEHGNGEIVFLSASIPQAGGSVHVGIATSGCKDNTFDRITLGPAEKTQMNSDGTTERQLAPWRKCVEVVHPLQREEECNSILKNKPGFSQRACKGNFCSHCCQYYAVLLDKNEKAECAQQCQNNNKIVQLAQENLSLRVKQCTDTTGGAFSHCSKADFNCLLEACHFCCVTHEPDDATGTTAEKPFRLFQPLDAAACTKACTERWTETPPFETEL